MKLRAAVHVHSDWSYDGSWTLDRLATAFGEKGYDVVLMTEHDRGFDESRWRDYCAACAESSSPELLFVPGIEYSDADNVTHILCWSEEISFLGEDQDTLLTLEAAAEANACAVFAHPWRKRAHERYRPSWVPHLVGVETWNRKADGIAPRKEAVEMVRGTELTPYASLDFHRARQFFPLAMEVDVEDRPADVASVLDALRDRRTRALAFGRPLELFTSGFAGGAVRAAEATRSSVAATIRRLKS